MTPTEDKANRARALLADPLLRGALASVEKDIWDRIKNSEPQQQQLREHLYCMIKGLELFAGALGAHVTQLQVETQRQRNR